MFFERKLLFAVRTWVDKPVIVVVTGMRQVGKTTLFRLLFDEIKSDNKVFLDLENPVNQRLFQETDFDNIWANLKAFNISNKEKAFIFLDEIQVMPQAVQAVKYLFDHYNVQFFLTGSSSFYLKNLFSESLAGRKVLFELFPLDFEEFLLFNGVKKEFQNEFVEKDRHKNQISFEKTIKFYEEFLQFGGFPKVVLSEKAVEKKVVLEDIFKSYFEKDVRVLADFKNMALLRDTILLLMRRTGSKINISRISSELGVNRETIYSYLSFLEATYFCSFVSPLSNSVDREVSGSKKVYICDTGLLNHFAQVSSGAIFENAVFNILKKIDEINYYQRRSGVEIDFILKNKKIALEVKEKGTTFDVNHLAKLADAINVEQRFLVSKAFSQEKSIIPATEL